VRHGRKLARNLGICPECGHHGQLTAGQRIASLFDPDSVESLRTPTPAEDPLHFTDVRPYADRLREARKRTGLDEAVVCVRGRIEGHPLVAAVMDFGFLGGSLGTAAGEAITACAETALAERVPLLLVCASGGARMQEGALSLMQMVKTSQALGQLDAAGVFTVCLATDPTYGGVAASFASLGDVLISEPGARLGFAGRRVIMQTIRQSLPEDFQTAEFLLEHGLVDMVRKRTQLRRTLCRLLGMATRPDAAGARQNPQQEPKQYPEQEQPSWRRLLVADPRELDDTDNWEAVRRAREVGRRGTLDFAATVFDDFEELRGDRLGGDCTALVGGLARLGRQPVVLLGHHKGHDAAELRARNFGMASPAGYRKAARLMRLAAKLGLPVVTLIDTPGAYPGRDAEEQGQSLAIAENLRLMASLPVPVVSVIVGEGGSGGALALAVADRVYALNDTTYSVISPEGCAAILWKDAGAAPRAAAAMGVAPRDLLAVGIIDGVLRPASDPGQAARVLRDVLIGTLDDLAALPADELLARRHARYRRFGSPAETVEAAEAAETAQAAQATGGGGERTRDEAESHE
jgi:acetyl-CoA carboxylase carboxyl transferase subunit beta